MCHHLSLNIWQRVRLWIKRPWFDSQRIHFTACGHSDCKGANDVFGRPGISLNLFISSLQWYINLQANKQKYEKGLEKSFKLVQIPLPLGVSVGVG